MMQRDPRARAADTPDNRHMTNAVSAGTAVVTLLFTDIVGSTALLSRLGDDSYEAVRRKHFRMLHDAVLAAGGAEVKNLGDGLMSVFASSVDALGCAVAIQRAVARHNRRAADDRFDVRIGLHVGEPIREEEDYFGTPVVVAKRLCDLAGPGQILTSRLVFDLAGSRGGFVFTELGPTALKGLSEPIAVCAVGAGEAAGARPLPPALRVLSERGFVGRSSELATLRAAWQKGEGGDRQVVLVAGEPGIGKTTLAVRVAEQAAAEGAVVLFGRCDEESVVPFQPFVEAVSHYVSTAPADERASHVEPRAAELAPLVPSLDSEPGARRTGAESDRYRLFEAVADLFAGIATDAPILLLLDDLHWADRPSLQLLQHLVRRTHEVPLLIVGTYRDTDLDRTHPLAEVLVDMRRSELVQRVPLRGLEPDDVLALLAPDSTANRDLTALAETLWRETEGSPLFVREILRHLVETGSLTVEDGRYATRRRMDQLGIPDGVKEVIGRRLSRLSPDANSILLTASVIGREFDIDVIERLTDLDTDAVLDALDEATAAGIAAEGHRPGRYAFTHALVRQTLYESLSLTRRVRHHQRVGQALELRGGRSTEHLGELAYHFSMAAVGGQSEKAIEYCRLAGEANMANVAYEEAARQFATALEVAEETEASADVRARLLLGQGEAQWRSGDSAARPTFDAAARLARSHGDVVALAGAALGYAGASVRPIWVEVGVVNEHGIALLEEAIAALDGADERLRALLLSTLARELYWQAGSRTRRYELSEEAVGAARRLGDRVTLGQVLANHWLVISGPDRAAELVSTAEEEVALVEELDDPASTAPAYAYLAVGASIVGDMPRMSANFERYIALAERLRDPVLVLAGQYGAAGLAELEGRFAHAEKLRREAFARAQEAGDRNSVIHFLGAMAWSLLLQGRVAEVVGPAAGAVALYPRVADTVHSVLACAWAYLGDIDNAREHLSLAGSPDELSRDILYLLSLVSQAEAALVVGDLSRAARLYDLLLPYEDLWVTVAHLAFIGAVGCFLGSLASMLGRHEAA
ncbi:MAG: ATPase, partial [Acidimicrobiales bacterium]|nr:ATPase [Acidimicrobiales bacterium]